MLSNCENTNYTGINDTKFGWDFIAARRYKGTNYKDNHGYRPDDDKWFAEKMGIKSSLPAAVFFFAGINSQYGHVNYANRAGRGVKFIAAEKINAK